MCLIQLVKFRLYKIPLFQKLSFQNENFHNGVYGCLWPILHSWYRNQLCVMCAPRNSTPEKLLPAHLSLGKSIWSWSFYNRRACQITLLLCKTKYYSVLLGVKGASRTQTWKRLYQMHQAMAEQWQRPEATVIPVWKTSVCKRGICKGDILKHPIFNVLNFRGWIKLSFDTVG